MGPKFSQAQAPGLVGFGAGWRTGVFSLQEKPELYSRNLAVSLHLFCVLSAGEKPNTVFMDSEKKNFDIRKEKLLTDRNQSVRKIHEMSLSC